MNSLLYFPLSITRTHPLLFPLSAHAKGGNLLKYNAPTPLGARSLTECNPLNICELGPL